MAAYFTAISQASRDVFESVDIGTGIAPYRQRVCDQAPKLAKWWHGKQVITSGSVTRFTGFFLKQCHPRLQGRLNFKLARWGRTARFRETRHPDQPQWVQRHRRWTEFDNASQACEPQATRFLTHRNVIRGSRDRPITRPWFHARSRRTRPPWLSVVPFRSNATSPSGSGL